MSDYELTDSDYDYNENEKILLDTARKGSDNGSLEEEVYNILSGSEDSFHDDIEDNEDLPSSKAWGKRKRDYYSTDYIDKDFGGFQDKDAENAEFEEQEARAIQERLLKEIDESDYLFDCFKQVEARLHDEDKVEEKIQTDISGLSKREKLALFSKESPEFTGLVKDFEEKMLECNTKLLPILELVKIGKIPNFPICKFIKTKYEVNLNYCTNILFYLLLKAHHTAVRVHPVVKRLFQQRQLLKQMESLDAKVFPQVEIVMNKIKNGEEIQFDMKSITNLSKRSKPIKHMMNTYEAEEIITAESISTINGEKESVQVDDNAETEDRRAITYQIAKNKGLTPYRKKELRNPRVKHRLKYQKAKIRRKGQVREPRKELQKYSGEISGIKIGISKSIKLK